MLIDQHQIEEDIKKKIEKAIKEGIHDIIAEESIIGKSGKKKIKDTC